MRRAHQILTINNNSRYFHNELPNHSNHSRSKSPGMAQHGHQRIIKRQCTVEIADPKNTCENTAQAPFTRCAANASAHYASPMQLLRRLCGDKPQRAYTGAA